MSIGAAYARRCAQEGHDYGYRHQLDACVDCGEPRPDDDDDLPSERGEATHPIHEGR